METSESGGALTRSLLLLRRSSAAQLLPLPLFWLLIHFIVTVTITIFDELLFFSLTFSSAKLLNFLGIPQFWPIFTIAPLNDRQRINHNHNQTFCLECLYCLQLLDHWGECVRDHGHLKCWGSFIVIIMAGIQYNDDWYNVCQKYVIVLHVC